MSLLPVYQVNCELFYYFVCVDIGGTLQSKDKYPAKIASTA